ncbi:MAG TPA: tetraacyldisaccharide 4'-kinase [Gemmatimonadales bacterium]|nr:tetraacyldisaccharide 4'-kinase [Gemmatimonadales bacterium]
MSDRDWRVRLVRRLWRRRSWKARAARTALLPFSALYGTVVTLRALPYRLGIAGQRRLTLPAIAVGNLTVGGTGKTPLTAWIAAECRGAGRRPGILLRGYGRDEVLLHRHLVPEAVVVANPDRAAGAALARMQGANVLVLDDAFQVLDTARDLNIALLSAEQARVSPWVLPAGPWREGWGALRRADLLIVTRKRAEAETARALADRLQARWPRKSVAVVRLGLAGFVGMRSGTPSSVETLRGRRIVVAAAIADPESFAVQVRATGATVQLMAFQDHHEYGVRDVDRLVQGARAADYLVVTEKDAVKLRALWPDDQPEPLVAILELTWERNREAVAAAIARVLAIPVRPTSSTTTHET